LKEYGRKYRKTETGIAKRKLESRTPKARLLRNARQARPSNKEYMRKYLKEYKIQRMQTDINFRLCVLLRSRLNSILKGKAKAGSAIKDLGCSLEYLKRHLESLFQPGMTWENKGKWHIDHIIPLSLFDLEDRNQLLKACHYTNLQPLWARDNISKGNRV
jgi:hypothetical protein